MSRFTLGNLDQNLSGPDHPSAIGQLITAKGNFKFTDHVGTGVVGPLAFNLAFAKSYAIRQTQKGGGAGGVKHGFCDEQGNYFAGTTGADQDDPASITAAQLSALGHPALYYKIEYAKPGAYTFIGNAG